MRFGAAPFSAHLLLAAYQQTSWRASLEQHQVGLYKLWFNVFNPWALSPELQLHHRCAAREEDSSTFLLLCHWQTAQECQDPLITFPQWKYQAVWADGTSGRGPASLPAASTSHSKHQQPVCPCRITNGRWSSSGDPANWKGVGYSLIRAAQGCPSVTFQCRTETPYYFNTWHCRGMGWAAP